MKNLIDVIKGENKGNEINGYEEPFGDQLDIININIEQIEFQFTRYSRKVDMFYAKGKLIDVPNDDTPIQICENVSARFFDAPHPNFAKLVVLEISGKRICVLADSESYDGIPFKYIKGCDFLIYDGMFDDAEYIRNIGRGHSTWQEGVRLAQKTGVKQLIISHHNWESSDAVLIDREEKARLMYPATSFARVGEKFEI